MGEADAARVGECEDWRLEAAVDGLEHQCLGAEAGEENRVVLPASGTGTRGRFVLVEVATLRQLLAASRAHLERP